MNKTALVLAAHGSRHEPEVNAQIGAWAAQIEARALFDEVAVAFHQGTPAFAEVLDEIAAPDVTVVPVMTSAGYYSDTVLPRELKKNHRYDGSAVRVTAPLGLHPAMPDLIGNRLEQLFARYELRAADTTVALIGHGTPRHAASRNSTISLAETLGRSGNYGEVLALFLDDAPPVDALLALTSKPQVVVIPFLIAAGPHATQDIPRRIGMELSPRLSLPFLSVVGGRNVLCDVPVGSSPGIVDLILDLALAPHGGRAAQRAVEVA